MSGNFIVNLEIQTNEGCISTFSQNIESYPNPVANFNFDEACFGETILFTNNSSISTGIINSLWAFDDEQTSAEDNPEHFYLEAGTYNVKLVVTSGYSCVDSIVKTVNVFSNPIADFTASNVCDGELSNFTNHSSVQSPLSITQNTWDFDNGTNSIQTNPSVQFLNSGT